MEGDTGDGTASALRGQLSPTKITNANVKNMGIANGISNWAKKFGDTIDGRFGSFVTSQYCRKFGLRNRRFTGGPALME